jgi:biotin synthase-like enzyme
MVNVQRAETQRQLDLAQVQLKITTKEELRNELVTRELFEERFKTIDERFKTIDEKFKRQDFKLNVLIALAFVSLTFANPTFVELVKHVVK